MVTCVGGTGLKSNPWSGEEEDITTDASPFVLGAVISNIMLMSHLLHIPPAGIRIRCEQKYSQMDKKAQPFIGHFTECFIYLCGRKVTIITGNKPLTIILNPHKVFLLPTTRMLRLCSFCWFWLQYPIQTYGYA